MNDDYYRRRIGPVNMFLSIISGWISGISGLHNIPFFASLVGGGWLVGGTEGGECRWARPTTTAVGTDTRTTFFLLPPTWLGARSLELEKATGSFITNTPQTFVLIILYFPSSKFPPNLYTPMATKVAQKRVSTAFYTRSKTFPAIRQC